MKKIILMALFCAIGFASNAQRWGVFNLYSLGSTSFNDDPIGHQSIGTSGLSFNCKAMNMKSGLFIGADCSLLLRGLLGGGKSKLEYTNKEDYTGLDQGVFSLRMGGMFKPSFGLGVDMDIRCVYLHYSGPSYSSKMYDFNGNKIINEFNFGLVYTGMFPIVKDLVYYSPSLVGDMMFTERQTTPVDGYLLGFENAILINLGGFIINVEPDWQFRKLYMATDKEKFASTMFAFRFGVGFGDPRIEKKRN